MLATALADREATTDGQRESAALGEVDRRAQEAAGALTRRADDAEAWLRQADERFVGLAVHSTERADALTARVVEGEDRLAALEIEAAELRDVVRRLADPADAAAHVGDDVAYWRWRLGTAGTGAPLPTAASRDGPVARVASDVGALLLPADDEVMLSFLRQFGEWERQESDVLRALLRPGMTFVDIGAHVGYMTLLAAAAVGPAGRGFAFEPEPRNFRLLRANVANQRVDHVHLVPAAAWHASGRLPLSLCTDNSGDHRTYPMPGRVVLDVPAFAVDDVLGADVMVDVVKVDAQGTDDLAIRGMERALARSRPSLVVEFWPDGITQRGDSPTDVLRYYRELRYDLSVIGGPEPTAMSLEAVLDAALSSPTAFCSLLLTPSP